MKKKVLIAGLVVLLLAVLLIPIPEHLKDGGTVIYRSMVYTVTKEHSIATEEEIEETGKMYNEGTIIEIFGVTVFDNVK